MAVTAASRRQVRLDEYDFEGYAVTGGETVVAETVWLQSLVVTNVGTTDATLTVTDNQGTPIGLYPLWIVPASATSSELQGLFDGGRAVKLSGGMKITASANTQLYVRGSYGK